MIKYVLEQSEGQQALYLTYGEEKIPLPDNTVAILFSDDRSWDNETSIKFTLHKHGQKDLVEKHFYRDLSAQSTAEKMFENSDAKFNFKLISFVVDSPEKLEDLNKCLEITGYLGIFLEKYDLLKYI